MLRLQFSVLVGLLASASGNLAAGDEPPSPSGSRIDFVRDIEPIFAAKCYSCHGPQEQEGQLRLDVRAIVRKGGISGSLVVPGQSAQSLLYKRLIDDEQGDRMPLDQDPLTDEQIELIRRWMDQGAAWPDGFGAQTHTVQTHWAYLPPQRPKLPAAKGSVWVQTPIDAFILDRLRDQKLAPSQSADGAVLLRRVFIDLIGLPPSVSQVDAYLADASPNAYEKLVDRLLASPQYGARWARPWLDAARYADSNGYQADQYRSVWPYRDWVIQAMNADMPFDRFTTHQIAGDLLPCKDLNSKIATGFHRLTTCNVEAGVDPEENRVNQIIDRVNTTGTVWLGTTIECAQCHNHKYDPFQQRDYYRLFAFYNNTPMEVEGNGVTYNFVGPKLNLPLTPEQENQRQELQARLAQAESEHEQLVAQRLLALPQWERQLAEANCPDEQVDIPAGIAKILQREAALRNNKQSQRLELYFAALDPRVKELNERIATIRKEIDVVKPATTLVMIESPEPRMTSVFRRGNFRDKGAQVTPGTPGALPKLPSPAADNRLGLARWLVARNNPLTARVAVNRWWAQIFGRGIVETIEDFGTQGERPTHPELLDWLAVELMDSGWSMKRIHKLIVTSSVYQQTSRLPADLIQRDPYNQWYARAPRFRLPAEAIRDNALAISGLLSHQLAGPPIFPPQPPGVWRHVGRNAPKYNVSQGNDRFRRGIFVIWRRSAPYPSFTNFDAPDRASCVVKRPRTNTPLQALTLMNDPAYVEMALALGQRIAAEPALDLEQRVRYAIRLCVARQPQADEVQHLVRVYQQERQNYERSPELARALIGDLACERVDPQDLAAWFVVASILLNLDETITRG